MSYYSLPKGSRVIGTYHGVAFVGAVESSHSKWNGETDFHVRYDHPITVMGSERTSGCVTVKSATGVDDQYNCRIIAL